MRRRWIKFQGKKKDEFREYIIGMKDASRDFWAQNGADDDHSVFLNT